MLSRSKLLRANAVADLQDANNFLEAAEDDNSTFLLFTRGLQTQPAQSENASRDERDLSSSQPQGVEALLQEVRRAIEIWEAAEGAEEISERLALHCEGPLALRKVDSVRI